MAPRARSQYTRHESPYYGDVEEDDYEKTTLDYDASRQDDALTKPIRVRVPVIRSRSVKEHAVTVVRKRPLVPYSKSQTTLPVQEYYSPTTQRVVTRTRIRNIDSSDFGYEGDFPTYEDESRSVRPKVTVTRRRKIVPSATPSLNQRERVTRKKLVNVRPIPQPSPTVAIITTGFFTAPSFEQDEYYYDTLDSAIPTPDFNSPLYVENLENPIKSATDEQSGITDATVSRIEDPIIITDNFFYPINHEETNTKGGIESNDFGLEDTIDTSTPLITDVGTSNDEIGKKGEIGPARDVANSKPEVLQGTKANGESLKPQVSTEKMTSLHESIDRHNHSNENEKPNQDNGTRGDVIEATPVKTYDTPSESNAEEDLRVIPIHNQSSAMNSPGDEINLSKTSLSTEEVVSSRGHDLESSEILTVVPLGAKSSGEKPSGLTSSDTHKTSSSSSPSLESSGPVATDDVHSSSSQSDSPQLAPSKVTVDWQSTESVQATPELQTSVSYSETVVTSTRLRTYTYVVTKLNGAETEVTSSTTVRPKVTTLTLTLPVTVTVTPTPVSSLVAFNTSQEPTRSNGGTEEEGRRFNLATRVMSNGVEVIVAGTTPAYRWENSNPQPTLTLSEAVLMLLPQEKPNDFVTKTCMTTFTYLNTITRDGTTIVSTDQQVIANTATEERHRKPVSEAASVTLEASPTLQTEVFKTTYTYLTLNTDHPDEKHALGSSTKVIANTVTAPQYYLDMVLEPSEAPRPETNTYYSTRMLEKTFIEDGKTRVGMTNDVVTQLIITETAPPSHSSSSLMTSATSDGVANSESDIAKTYYITYTYYNTYLEKDSTVVKTNVATSSDIVYEKAAGKKTSTKSVPISATPEPIQIFATKTYLTTFTYFTTLLQAGTDGATSTTISSRTQVVENIITESIAPSLLDAGYMNALLTTSKPSESLENVVTGSTIIFFDDEEPIAPSATTHFDASSTSGVENDAVNTSAIPADSVGSESNDATSRPAEQEQLHNEEDASEDSTDPPPNKKPSQVSNLLSLGSLGINSLSALGPVITAMAGLLQGKSSATRRNGTETATEPPTTTTSQRSPIYIPVGEFAGDIDTAESQNIAHQLANGNHLPETRHKVTSNLADGIPISPGEIITANSDVIIGKPAKLGPRPPQTFEKDENIGMKPPPVPVPNIPVHPVLEVIERESPKPIAEIQRGSQKLEIFPAHQIYEDHIKVPESLSQPILSQNHHHSHQTFIDPPLNRISSKQDILEHDPLLIPPSVVTKPNIDLKNRYAEKSRHPWSAKDPLTAPNNFNEERIQFNHHNKDLTGFDDHFNHDESRKKPQVPEPIVHQVPHVIDRSTGQPLLVNIQPSQVANVVIPEGGTQALIFGDTSEPHKSGQYFDDPSPYPEPEVGPGFVGIDKVENLPQNLKGHDSSSYMSFPSGSVNPKTPSLTLDSPSQESYFAQTHQAANRLEKIPIQPHDNQDFMTGQGHVHTEILVHHGNDGSFLKQQPRPSVPSRNYQNVHFPPRREHTNVHIPHEHIPPRRTEVSLSTDHDVISSSSPNSHWKGDKKHLRNPPPRWNRPTIKPRPPTRPPGHPYGRPVRVERPGGPAKQPVAPPLQQLPPKIQSQHEYTRLNQQHYLDSGNLESVLPPYSPKTQEQIHINDKMASQGDEMISYQDSRDHLEPNHEKNPSNNPNSETNSGNKMSSAGEHSSATYEKPIDSDVDASENIRVTSGSQDDNNPSGIVMNQSNYFIGNANMSIDDHVSAEKPLQDGIAPFTSNENEGDIIIGSEKKRTRYPALARPSSFAQQPSDLSNSVSIFSSSVIPVVEPNGHSRPFSKQQTNEQGYGTRPEIITKAPGPDNLYKGQVLSGLGQVIQVQNEKISPGNSNERPHSPTRTRLHPGHPLLITKVKPQVPGPVIVSSGKQKQGTSNKRPSLQFSLPIDSTGEENESKTQTERPPSNAVNKQKGESLNTAFQTNFASTDAKNDNDRDDHQDEAQKNVDVKPPITELQRVTTPKTKTLSQEMSPPPVPSVNKKSDSVKTDIMESGLKAPPPPAVLGLSPPPVDITSTSRPQENKVNHSKMSASVSGLKPPPIYIPLKESSSSPLPPPSTSMVPPTPRPSAVRPYLVDILSQDMFPPPVGEETAGSLQVTTVRPGVAVSGSIQIATAVAASNIPVIQDVESKIPIVHGTVDLPVVIDVPEFLKPVDTKKPDYVSVYTVLPFETKQKSQIKATISPTSTTATRIARPSVIKNDLRKHNHHQSHPSTSQTAKKPNREPDFPVILEPSTDIHVPISKTVPTKSLNLDDVDDGDTQNKVTATVMDVRIAEHEDPLDFSELEPSSSQSRAIKNTDLKIKESASKMMEIIGTVVHEFIQNSTNERVEIKPQEVTRYETLTVTRTETSVVGSPPTTRTVIKTHTLTSTRVETVTETILRPTSVISTITSTILHSVTHVPTQDRGNDNESILVVMSDHKTPGPGAEEVEAEYGDEDVSRDEQETSGNEIHRVLSGGILGAPSVPIRPPKIQCIPECKASKSEICAESNGEMQCICRPGFSRDFPGKSCDPTYTFTIGIGLDRIGRDRFTYDSAKNDTNLAVFRRHSDKIKDALYYTVMRTGFRDAYRGVKITRFSADPAKVLFNLQLSSNTDEAKLKDTIRKYLVESNFTLPGNEIFASKDLGMVEVEDFNECAAETGGPYHDCSSQAACINLKGTYQCSCREGWADISENTAYPGRVCSQAPLGCGACNNKGHCLVNTYGQEVCECFPWYSGKKCQINLKVLLFAIVTMGVILVGLLAVCLGVACLRNPNRRRRSADRRAMISGMGGDTSSEGSVAELAIPHHVPHILPPPPQMVAPAPPIKKMPRKVGGKTRRAPKKPAPVVAPVQISSSCPPNEQRDRSLTVMIPRAKYRSMPQSATPQNFKTMSTFAVDEHKLIDYLESGAHPSNRKPSLISHSDFKESDHRMSKQHSNFAPTGALVSAGFQVSATVTRPLDAESTLARSCGETTVEPSTKLVRSSNGVDFGMELDSTLARSCADTTIHASTKQQLLRLELAEAGSTLARSCGETTIQPPTKIVSGEHRRNGGASDCQARDSASEGHTMAERDLGSTLRLPAQHASLYNQDRTTSSDRESNFDSL